jgi:hypothetical protein
MTTSTNPTITTGCIVYVRKGCNSWPNISKGTTLQVLEITPMGSDHSHQVRVLFKSLNGSRRGSTFAMYARHINRLSDPFTRLNQGDPTTNIEIEFLTAPVTQ